jgi:hypothetical protein
VELNTTLRAARGGELGGGTGRARGGASGTLQREEAHGGKLSGGAGGTQHGAQGSTWWRARWRYRRKLGAALRGPCGGRRRMAASSVAARVELDTGGARGGELGGATGRAWGGELGGGLGGGTGRARGGAWPQTFYLRSRWRR